MRFVVVLVLSFALSIPPAPWHALPADRRSLSVQWSSVQR